VHPGRIAQRFEDRVPLFERVQRHAILEALGDPAWFHERR
jgi:hypothetical protein